MHDGYLNIILRQGINTRFINPSHNSILPEAKIFNSALLISQWNENYQYLQNYNSLKKDDGELEDLVNEQIIAPERNLRNEVSEINQQEKLSDAKISFQTTNKSAEKLNLKNYGQTKSGNTKKTSDKHINLKDSSDKDRKQSNTEIDFRSFEPKIDGTPYKNTVPLTEKSARDIKGEQSELKIQRKENKTTIRAENKQIIDTDTPKNENSDLGKSEKISTSYTEILPNNKIEEIKVVNVDIPRIENSSEHQPGVDNLVNHLTDQIPVKKKITSDLKRTESRRKLKKVVTGNEAKNTKPERVVNLSKNKVAQSEFPFVKKHTKPNGLEQLHNSLKEKQKEIDSLKIKLKQLESKIDSNLSVKKKVKEKYLPGPPVSTNLGGWSIKERSYFR